MVEVDGLVDDDQRRQAEAEELLLEHREPDIEQHRDRKAYGEVVQPIAGLADGRQKMCPRVDTIAIAVRIV